MFGLNNAIRSIATGTASSVDSVARSIVGTFALAEKAIERRLDADVQNAKTTALRLEAIKDLKETAKSVGHTDLSTSIKESEDIFALIRK